MIESDTKTKVSKVVNEYLSGEPIYLANYVLKEFRLKSMCFRVDSFEEHSIQDEIYPRHII